MALPAAVLALAIAAYVYFFKGDFGWLSELAALQPPGWRRRRYRVWIAKSWLLFAGPSLLGLALLGRLDLLLTPPVEFVWPAYEAGYPAPIQDLLIELAVGLAAGSVVGGGWSIWRGRRGRLPAMLGDFSSLLPQDRVEARLAAGSAISAGITEEIYFRLLIPLLVTDLAHNPWAGFAVGTLLFAGASISALAGRGSDRPGRGVACLFLPAKRRAVAGDAGACHYRSQRAGRPTGARRYAAATIDFIISCGEGTPLASSSNRSKDGPPHPRE